MRRFWIAMASLSVAGAAQAHTGHATDGALQGVLHPLTGLDHLAVMLMVGLWASLLARRQAVSRRLLPAGFLCGMIVGAMLPVLSISMAVVEPGILGSMLLLGFALLVLQYLPLAAAVPIVAAFGVLHGYAHGAEVPADGGFVAYGIGVVASTAMLHAGGIFCGTLLLRHGATLAVRLAGAAAVLGGIAMAAA